MTEIKSYQEMSYLETFEERLCYLRLSGGVGRATFGFDRYINQRFYTSREWKDVRDYVIVRDDGCDLGILDRPIPERPLIHHINPMDIDDIVHRADWILDPDFLITTCHRTHNAIHYGAESLEPEVVIERRPGDTNLW